ncbi:uncharacterized protein LOC119669809 [Teleopsis dalmanni]|uniref:uncharacterized protein LOC119669809 n=1 Tax=Teleopsis dalmanni TaxID=139649 RepID=UPI0018CEB621|nr:uncharacterized protein LOC119669809 [Teleopsis dalmanni]
MFRKWFASKESDDSSNDSFETLEKMCNKSASDPDSTLHKYLYGKTKDGDERDNVNKTSEYNLDLNINDEHTDQTREDFKNIFCGDLTQLDDIEPPTRLWENSCMDTIDSEKSLVKLVCSIRSSTFIEEGEESEVSCTSYYTANEDSSDEMSTNFYTTVYDNCQSYNYNLTNVKKHEFAGVDGADTHLNKNELMNVSSGNKKADAFCCDAEDKNIFDFNFKFDDSIIDLASTEKDTYDQDEIDEIIKSAISLNAIKCESEPNENSQIGVGDVMLSLSFDNTLEEVDYLINQYLAETNTGIVDKPIKKKGADEKQNSKTVYGVHKTKAKTFKKKSVLTKEYHKRAENKENHSAINKNKPKLDLFKNTKPLVRKTNNEFKDIVSPIGAYIHKTTNAPLMINFKPINTTSNINEAAVFKNLDFKSNCIGKMTTYDESDLIPNTSTKLPKKAYISSDCKNFYDERRPVKIPGGQKIHKFLDSATLPAVVRHEGKAKIPPGMLGVFAKESKKEVSEQHDSTLFGFDVQAGEISIYTIRDAQQFK